MRCRNDRQIATKRVFNLLIEVVAGLGNQLILYFDLEENLMRTRDNGTGESHRYPGGLQGQQRDLSDEFL